MIQFEYDSICEIHCTNTNKTQKVIVDKFKPNKILIVRLAGNDISLRYNKKHDIYIGSIGGSEFTSNGPEYWYL